ncbi:MAG: hypothetical protein HRF51_05230 [bacterium]|jgi:hypothetical protein
MNGVDVVPTVAMVLIPIITSAITFLSVIIMGMINIKMNKKNIDAKSQELRILLADKERERKFEVGKAVLQRSLQAMQEGFQNVMYLNRILNSVSAATISEVELESQIAKVKSIRDWYDANCFYIPDSIRKKFLQLVNSTFIDIKNKQSLGDQRERAHIWKNLIDLVDNIENAFQQFFDKYSLIRDSAHDGND